jgi:hypothetical protein
LKIPHLAPGGQSTAKHLRLAFLIAVREGDGAAGLASDVQQAKVENELRDGVWTVRATLASTPLELARDAADRKKIVTQTINGRRVTKPKEPL